MKLGGHRLVSLALKVAILSLDVFVQILASKKMNVDRASYEQSMFKNEFNFRKMNWVQLK